MSGLRELKYEKLSAVPYGGTVGLRGSLADVPKRTRWRELRKCGALREGSLKSRGVTGYIVEAFSRQLVVSKRLLVSGAGMDGCTIRSIVKLATSATVRRCNVDSARSVQARESAKCARKRTGLFTWNLPLQCIEKLTATCSGQRKQCFRSGKPHVILRGCDSHKLSKSKRTQDLPNNFADSLAFVFLESPRS